MPPEIGQNKKGDVLGDITDKYDKAIGDVALDTR